MSFQLVRLRADRPGLKVEVWADVDFDSDSVWDSIGDVLSIEEAEFRVGDRTIYLYEYGAVVDYLAEWELTLDDLVANYEPRGADE